MPSSAVQLPDDLFFQRLAIEYSIMVNGEPGFHCHDGDLSKYRGVIAGLGPYEGGFFKVEINLPREFPYEPPELVWHTKTWHPNITDSTPARVCQSILNKDWNPSANVNTIIESLRTLLTGPNPDDPLNYEAADQMKNNSKKFMEKLKFYLRTYATPDQAFWET